MSAVALAEATAPPERRGVARDLVRLLVGRGDGTLTHAVFRDLPRLLDPGDLLVVNTSATLPAALDAVAPGRPAAAAAPVHSAPGLRPGRAPVDGGAAHPGGPGHAAVRCRAGAAGGSRSPAAAARACCVAGRGCGRRGSTCPVGLHEHLEAHGRPIRYAYAGADWPISDYQTVFATQPGSAEMPSAGRAFTPELVTALVAAGIEFAPIVLHTGVSSPETGEPPFPEPYRVPEATARHVNAVRAAGGRVIAVGTTAVRALETAAGGRRDRRRRARAGRSSWSTSERGVGVVDGLLTGWHAPEATHLDLVRAIAGRELVERCYAAAAAHGYLWHEFGDLNLLLP